MNDSIVFFKHMKSFVCEDRWVKRFVSCVKPGDSFSEENVCFFLLCEGNGILFFKEKKTNCFNV